MSWSILISKIWRNGCVHNKCSRSTPQSLLLPLTSNNHFTTPAFSAFGVRWDESEVGSGHLSLHTWLRSALRPILAYHSYLLVISNFAILPRLWYLSSARIIVQLIAATKHAQIQFMCAGMRHPSWRPDEYTAEMISDINQIRWLCTETHCNVKQM